MYVTLPFKDSVAGSLPRSCFRPPPAVWPTLLIPAYAPVAITIALAMFFIFDFILVT
jgi:hypothetical protein